MVTSLLRPYVLPVTEYAMDVGQGANAPILSASAQKFSSQELAMRMHGNLSTESVQ